MKRVRLRELGIDTGALPTGKLNAITDVAGVRVGHSTIIHDQPFVARTGVTAIWPAGPDIWTNAVFAGFHSFNGNGEMTGTIWVQEQGLLCAPVCITNTYSVGTVRDAIIAYGAKLRVPLAWHLPVAAETYDGWLNDIEHFAVKTEHVFAAIKSASAGAVAEGNVGGGTGMICHEFKGGIGTASRVVQAGQGSYTVGALVQANYGQRDLLRVDGVPVGHEIGWDVVPSHRDPRNKDGSIIVVLATDAPLLPIQCQRLARRATVGLAWVGGLGANSSGDIFLAFSTANRIPQGGEVANAKMLMPDHLTPLFQAAAEATEEAILNAMAMAETMTGQKGRIIHALPLDRLQDAMRKYGRLK